MRDTEEGCKWTNRRGLLPLQCDSEKQTPAVTRAVYGHCKSYVPVDMLMCYVTWLKCSTVLHEISRFCVRLCASLMSLVYISVQLWSIATYICELFWYKWQSSFFGGGGLNPILRFVCSDVSVKRKSSIFRNESTWTNLFTLRCVNTESSVTIVRTPVITWKFKALCFFMWGSVPVSYGVLIFYI